MPFNAIYSNFVLSKQKEHSYIKFDKWLYSNYILIMANISVAEAKNKLPHFIHQTEVSGPIIISRRNQDVAVLISKNDYDNLVKTANSNSILAKAEQFRNKQYFSNQEVESIFSSAKENNTNGSSWENNIFDGVLE